MARKDVFKSALESLIQPSGNPAPSRGPSKSILHAASLEAVDEGLARSLQLVDLDPNSIEDSEYADRLPYAEGDLDELVDSLRDSGQQIPILVQRLGAGRYRIIYGRRRLAAIRIIGGTVRALVADMDDTQRIIAQGVENTVRQDLSFIEKALFAHRLRQAGVDEGTIRQSLNIDVGLSKATTISTMRMVVDTLGEELISAIGRASAIGRPRWRALADLYRQKAAQFADVNQQALVEVALAQPASPVPDVDPSERRFKAVLTILEGTGRSAPAASQPETVIETPALPAKISRNRNMLTVTFGRRDNPDFHRWIDAQAEDLVQELYQRWQQQNDNP